MVHEFLSKEFMSYYESLLCTWYLVPGTIRILNSAFFNRRSAFDILKSIKYQVSSIKYQNS